MAKNMANLQQALKGKTVAHPAVPVEPAEPVTTYKAPSRKGKTNLTAYLSPAAYPGSHQPEHPSADRRSAQRSVR
jgi:hypothetical protein